MCEGGEGGGGGGGCYQKLFGLLVTKEWKRVQFPMLPLSLQKALQAFIKMGAYIKNSDEIKNH